MSHLMAGHPAYKAGWGRSRQPHYLLQLVYVYSFRVKGHYNTEVSISKSMRWSLRMNYVEIYGHCISALH